ncbi:MAG: hypothetical protein ACPG42_02095 [Alphaproteobacteria bacterium]
MEIPVWQFVRIMVACEKRPNSRLLAANQESWTELDDALSGLAQTDFDAYSHLMMHTDVHVSAPNKIELRRVLDTVLRDLKLAKRRTRAGSSERTDLEYEISELNTLFNSLGGRVQDDERDGNNSKRRPQGRGQSDRRRSREEKA